MCDSFLEACEREGEEREEFLRDLEHRDSELRREVEVLLEYDRREHGIVDHEGGFEEMLDHFEDDIPEQIGSYRIHALLGEGGMGVVYRAEQDYPRRSVALKVIRPGLLTHRVRESFRQEVQVLGRLQHPGIAQIYDADFAPLAGTTLPYFAMELVEGPDLLEFARLRASGIGERVALLIRVCEAVHHAHLRGVVHRDLKPSNILVNEAGQPKILDFGIARATSSDEATLQASTHRSSLAGTLPYMSPEQAAGRFADLDARSDVYSLGVVLYEVLAGQRPLEVSATSLPVALAAIQVRVPMPLGQRDARLRGDLEAIVDTCLRKEPELRYDSAGEIAAELQRYRDGVPVRARPLTAAYRMRKFVERHRTVAVALTALFVVLLSALSVSLHLLKKEQVANAQAENNLNASYRMADPYVLAGLLEEAENLWPRRVQLLVAYDGWLERADSLIDRQDLHRSTLASLLAVYAASNHSQSDAAQARQLAILQPYVRDLEQFASGQPPAELRSRSQLLFGEGARVDRESIRARRRVAAALRDWTVEEFLGEWQDSIEQIRRSELYGGLRIAPQTGLVPLGADPQSGLHEFWCPESGERPRRDPVTGRLQLEENSGLVFVLVPPGEAELGNDEYVDEGPRHRVEIAAFFLSKYEMTQYQWLVLTHDEPSYHRPSTWEGVTLLHPVESVTWLECTKQLSHFALRLPLEAEWEYAASAGKPQTWWVGEDPLLLVTAANLADESLGGNYSLESWDDGYTIHAPVDSLEANGFGLHHIHGNVAEWCQDAFSKDGYFGETDEQLRVNRGGSYLDKAECARCSFRGNTPWNTPTYHLGVRPARDLESQ